jgi:hypothetical protein
MTRDLLTDRETARILGKKINSLYKTVDFFDSDDKDEWDLVEGEHFEFTTRSGDYRERRFYEEGVEALAEYLDRNTPGIIKLVGEALTHRRRKRKQMLVSRRITQELIESGSLVEVRGELGFVGRKTCINVLQTNGRGINNSIDRLSQSGMLDGEEGLEIEKHFLLSEEGEKIWSQKGLASMAVDMSHNSSINKARKAWVGAVGEVVEDCFKIEIKRLAAAPLRIDQAIAKAKRAVRDTCQVTGKKKARGKDLSLDGHHLFDKSNRSDLADFSDNILVVESSIHSDFHSWKGSSGCEPKDFLNYSSEIRGDLFDSSNSRSMERFNRLTVKLTQLQKNYENNHLRYH